MNDRLALLLPCSMLVLTACPGDDTSLTSESSAESSTGGPSGSTSIPSITADDTLTATGVSSGDSGGATSTTGSTSSADSTSTDTTTTDTDTADSGDSSSSTGGCSSDEVLCDGACIDPLTDAGYCGAIDDCMDKNAGFACAKDQACDGGLCLCTDPTLLNCDGTCIDPETSQDFCGATGDCIGPNAGAECPPSAECLASACLDSCDNCGFETGDFTDWTTVDLINPYLPLVVTMGGETALDFASFAVTPTEGAYCASTGWDGDGPGTIEIGQDITLAAAPPADLVFDYRAGWELAMFGAMLDRTFNVQIEPAGGGPPMDTVLIHTAPAGNLTEDTGDLMGTVDLSMYAGQTVFIRFVFDVPENFSGPALAQLDNVRVVPQ